MKTQPNSEPKTIESTPISTIKAELQECLNRVELNKSELEFAKESGCTGGQIIYGANLDESLDKLGGVAAQHLPALLESHDLLEAERQWVTVGEALPELTEKNWAGSFSVIVSVRWNSPNQESGRFDGKNWWDPSMRRRINVAEWRHLIP